MSTDGERSSRQPRRVVLVTGLSGAGRTTVLDTLEDGGYEAIDNPPLDLVQKIISTAAGRSLAIGVDMRTRDFAVEPFLTLLDRLAADQALEVRLVFIECDDESLRRRYSETRRRHPLATDRPLIDSIAAERRLLTPLRDRADLAIDTSSLTPNDFRQVVLGHLGLETAASMAIFVTSFSYRNGLPRAADLVFDVRFLRNPHYVDALRSLSGRDQAVADYILADPDFADFYGQITTMLAPLLPRYEQEGKSYLTVAFGCTGGRHRSVFMAERLTAWLREKGQRVTLVHRELGLVTGRDTTVS